MQQGGLEAPRWSEHTCLAQPHCLLSQVTSLSAASNPTSQPDKLQAATLLSFSLLTSFVARKTQLYRLPVTMSFGFSVGDFIAALEIAHRVRSSRRFSSVVLTCHRFTISVSTQGKITKALPTQYSCFKEFSTRPVSTSKKL